MNIALGLVKEQDAVIRITEMNGRLISEKKYPHIRHQTLHLDMTGYPKGIYLVNILLEDEVITKKVILQ